MTSQPVRSHAWDRWLPVWHLLFAGALAVSTLLSVLGGGLDPAESVATVVLSVAAFGWYWAFFMRRRPWDQPLAQMLTYAAGAVAVWFLLVQISPGYGLLQFAIFAQFFFTLPRRWAVVASAGFAAVIVSRQAQLSAEPLEAQLPRLLATAMTIAFFVVLGSWIGTVIDQSAERQDLIDQLEASRREVAALEREAGALEERQRLAREIHDTLAQGFTSVVMHLEAADAVLAQDPPRAAEHIDQARRVARESLTESRRFLWDLRPETLERSSLPETLERIVRRWADENRVHATFTVTGAAAELHPDVEVTLLRSAQEALANIRKHARASRVTLTLSYMQNLVSLDVRDDGRGFRATNGDGGLPDGGFGLLGLQERARLLGGSVSVESVPGQGTAVAVSVPALAPSGALTGREAPAST